jgi:hypothetical protein
VVGRDVLLVDVDDEQVLLELRGPARDLAVGADDDRASARDTASR